LLDEWRSQMGTKLEDTKVGSIAVRALHWARTGSSPDEAWLKALEEVYPDPDKLKNQIKHTCPKFAFGILCHRGHVNQVPPGGCPESEKKGVSGALTLKALELL